MGWGVSARGKLPAQSYSSSSSKAVSPSTPGEPSIEALEVFRYSQDLSTLIIEDEDEDDLISRLGTRRSARWPRLLAPRF
jgi:hypothetical protein